jgi:endonuclease/exonuclease/phosphatase family metal-dependent hydrolase
VPTLRLLSYNVRSLRDDADAVARVIRSAEPHVVCVQEAPRLWRWRSRCAALARRSGMVVVTGGRPAAANLILSSLDVDVTVARDVLFTQDRWLHQRGTALARLSFAGTTLVVGGTHLDLVEEPRLRHVAELHRAVATMATPDVPTIVAADVNDEPGSATWTALSGHHRDVWAAVGDGDGHTFSATNPRRRIDGVFADRRLGPVSATVLDSPEVGRASDHRPVLAELDVPVSGS